MAPAAALTLVGPEQDPYMIAIRADESAKSAHHRLDRMNGSIDRLGREVGDIRSDLRASIDAARQEAQRNFETVMRRLDRDAGIQEGAASVRGTILDSRWRLIGLLVSILGTGAATAVITYLVRH